MLKHLKLTNVGPAPQMEIDLAPRVNLLTGDNGLGKSFLLDIAWWALTRRWPHDLNTKLTSGYPARPTALKDSATIEFELTSKNNKLVEYTSKYVPRDQAWLGKSGRPWIPGLIIYAHSDGGFSVWDPARNYWKKKGGIDIQERLPGFVFSSNEVWDGLFADIDGKKTPICNGLLQDWANWIREGGELSAQMSRVLGVLEPAGESLGVGPLKRLSVNDARDIPTIRTPYSDAVPVLHASSGIRRILGLAYMLTWSWSEHVIAAEQLGDEPSSQVVILFDEIESHLHPRWQRTILSSVLQAVREMHEPESVQLLAATHSPLVMASAEPWFDRDQDAWFDLDLEPSDGGPFACLRRRDFVRRGDVSNWLTSEAFDLSHARSLEGETAIQKARALLRQPEGPTLEQAREVDQDLRNAGLSDIDPFWVRWGALMEKLEHGQ